MKLSSNVVDDSNDENNFSHKLLLTNTQASKFRKFFANNSSANIKLSKSQLYKIVQSVGFVGRLLWPLLKTRLPLMKPLATHPAHDVLETSPEGSLKDLTFRTYRGPSGDPQGTNTKTDDLMKKLFFRNYSPCITYISIHVFYRNNKYSKVLNEDFHGTSTGPSCGMSRELHDGTF